MFTSADPLLILAVVIVAGLLAGEVTKRIQLGSVTGQILVGVLLGAAGLDLFPRESVDGLQPVTHFALGVMVMVVGGHLNLRRLRNARKRLGILLACEVVITPVIVWSVVRHVYGADWPTAGLLATLCISTAPATIIALIAETRSKGVFVKTLVGAVALNNIACILMFEVARMAARVELDASVVHPLSDFFLLPLQQLGMAAVLGLGLGGLLILITRKVFKAERLATASMLTVMLTFGAAELIGASSLLACLFLGVVLANLTPDKDEIVESAFVNVRDAIFAVFFTLAGMHLDVEHLGEAGVIAGLVFTGRLVGKLAAARLAMGLAHATRRLRSYLGMALVPQAGVAVGLLLLVQDDPALSSISSVVLTTGLAVVTANEIVGPWLTRIALTRSGEVDHDRERLIDFLHEENIVTGFEASTKEQAIAQLVDVLIRTNRLDADRKALLASVLDRESQASTCFGSGLALPHGTLAGGDEIVGAMGISRTGMDFETPDGVPVYCMVVLATPPDQRNRHLSVLAALAQALGTDRNIQRQLFTAKSAAHAWAILHVEETKDFNYFLEDEEDDDALDGEGADPVPA